MPESSSKNRVRGHGAERKESTASKVTTSAKSDKKRSKKDEPITTADNNEGLMLAVKSDSVSYSYDQCGNCGTDVSDDHQGMKCECCDMWFHCKCEKVSDEVYTFFSERDNDRSICWYCKKCAVILRSVYQSVAKLEDGQKRLEAKMDNILHVIDDKMKNDWSINVEESQRCLDEKVNALMNIVEEKTVDSAKIHDCVEDAVRIQLLEDKEEEEEIR